jgi:DNA modification methylase
MENKTTNEEKRVFVYTTNLTPTVPETVTQNTPLSDLNLNWKEADLPEKVRTKHVHRLHPYLGKFIPQLVEIFLRKYFSPGQTILDPFAGSGTTLVQANELGINSIGYDISAFNVLLMTAKTKSYDLEEVKNEILDVLGKVRQQTQNTGRQLALWEGQREYEIQNIKNDYLSEWYDQKALRELIAYRNLIPQYEDQEILKVILSRAARSSRLTTHFDLDFPKKPQLDPYWCYKHGRICAPTQNAFQFLNRYSLDTIKRLVEFSTLRTDAAIRIIHADSRSEEIPLVDGAITSPPYVGLINYHEQHQYAYELLGLVDRRADEIGSADKGSSQKAKSHYQDSISQVFKNILKSMNPGGYMIVVAGDRYGLYDQIALNCGVTVEAIIQRHVNRRTGRRSSEFFEQVFVWRKS